jgi:hypothetical protein
MLQNALKPLACGNNLLNYGGGTMHNDSVTQLSMVSPTLLLRSFHKDYSLDTKVAIEVVLANLSGSPITVNGRLQFVFDYKYEEAYELRFEVVSPTGARIAPRQIMEDRLWPHPRVDDFVHLGPGTSCSRTVVITDYFDLSIVGSYKVLAEYHNYHTGQEFGLVAWLGRVNSNELWLDVKGT